MAPGYANTLCMYNFLWKYIHLDEPCACQVVIDFPQGSVFDISSIESDQKAI